MQNTQVLPLISINDKRIQRVKYDAQKERTALTIFGYSGQTKLLFSSIQYLTLFFSEQLGPMNTPVTIIYIGAAPGLSIPTLDEYFHDHIEKWLLYDPEKFAGNFCKSLCDLAKDQPERFQIISEFFTEQTAQQLIQDGLNPKKTIIMFDHRTSDKSPTKMLQDFKLTCDTVKSLRPISTWAKLRFPWPDIKKKMTTVYGLGGTIYVQPMTAKCSAECRLISSQDDIEEFCAGKITAYDLRDYEERMFGYNLEARWKTVIKIGTVEGLDYGNDSQLILHISREYLQWKLARAPTVDEVRDFVHECDQNLSESSGKGLRSFLKTPLALYPDLLPEVRIKEPKMIQEIRSEQHLQDNKRGKDISSNANNTKLCAKCKKSFTPKREFYRFCVRCNNRKK